MKKIIAVFLSVLIMASSFTMAASALTPEESQDVLDNAYNNMFEGVPGDVNGDGAFSVADARSALLSSAGLDEGTVNKTKADIDSDGSITAIDARTLLRVAASLEPQDLLYSAQMKLALFNALANHVKYSGEEFRKFTTEKTVSVSHDHQADIDDFNKQVNRIIAMMPDTTEEDKMDLGEILDSSGSDLKYTYTNPRNASKTNYPVANQDFSSILSLGDIVSITYQKNQSYEFAPKRSFGSQIREEDTLLMTGLDALTVTIRNEKLTDIPADSTTLSHGKCFDIPSKEDVMSGYEDINDQLGSMDMTSILGENAIFDVSANFGYINYHDSTITIYFKHDTKEVCAVVYDLNYDISVAMLMDIYVSLTGSDLTAMLNFRNKTINITDSEKLCTVCYFPQNYPYPSSD